MPRLRRKFIPRYAEGVQSIRSNNPEIGSVAGGRPSLLGKAKDSSGILDIIAPGAGTITSSALSIIEGAAEGDIASGLIGAVPVVGGLLNNVIETGPEKRKKIEEEAALKTEENIKQGLGKISGTDITKNQVLAERGKRFKKRIYQRGTKDIKTGDNEEIINTNPSAKEVFEQSDIRGKQIISDTIPIVNPSTGESTTFGEFKKFVSNNPEGKKYLQSTEFKKSFGDIDRNTFLNQQFDVASEAYFSDPSNTITNNSLQKIDRTNQIAGEEAARQDSTILGNKIENIRETSTTTRKRNVINAFNENIDKEMQQANNKSKNDLLSVNQQFEEGTRSIIDNANIPIEVERNELHFRKKGNRWKLIADFKGGKTHEAGGEDTEAMEGDVIFPESKRTKLLSLLDVNGVISKSKEPEFETERLKLPTDTPKEDFKAQKGVDLSNVLGLASQLTPALFNLSEGGKDARKEKRRFVQPRTAKFIDTSQESLNETERSFRVAQDNITKSSGGSAGTILANTAANAAARNRAKSSIFADKAQKAQQIENINTQIANRADQFNTRLAMSFDDKDAMNVAAKERAKAAGLSQLGEIGQNAARDVGLRKRNDRLQRREDIRLATVGSSDFSVNPTDILNYINTGKGDLSNIVNFKQSNREPVGLSYPESLIEDIIPINDTDFLNDLITE